MSVHVILRLNLCKQRDAEHSKEEQEQHQQSSNIHQLWNCQNEGLEDLLQVFSRLDQLKYSRNSKRSNDCRDGPNIDVEYLQKDDSSPG